MPNRRRFLQAAAALSAAPAVGAAGSANAAAPSVDLVVYEDALPDSRAFGRAALALGARVRRISAADITALWSGELRQMWRGGSAVIAGMTTRQPLFCLEQLAWDAGMRVAFREAHVNEQGQDWPAYAAQGLLSRRLDGPAPEMLTMADTLDDAPHLYSWIIAPAASRARTAGSV